MQVTADKMAAYKMTARRHWADFLERLAAPDEDV